MKIIHTYILFEFCHKLFVCVLLHIVVIKLANLSVVFMLRLHNVELLNMAPQAITGRWWLQQSWPPHSLGWMDEL